MTTEEILTNPALFLFTTSTALVSGPSSDSSSFPPPAAGSTVYDWERYGGFMLYVFGMLYIFLGFQVICEEYFVPALNIFCELMKMPDDFAGATLMGLCGCAPDILSGIFGMLVIHKDEGLGTIVGSLLFNHLAILGGTCLWAQSSFSVKPSSFLREVTFYAAGLVIMLWSLRDHAISWDESTIMLGFYIIFCVVCGFTPKIVQLFVRLTTGGRGYLLNNKSGGDKTILPMPTTDAGANEASALLVNESGSHRQMITPQPISYDSEPETTATITTTTTATQQAPSDMAASAPASVVHLPETSPMTAPMTPPSTEHSMHAIGDYPSPSSPALSTSVPISHIAVAQQKKESVQLNQERLKQTMKEAFAIRQQEIQQAKTPSLSGDQFGLSYGQVHNHGFLQKQSRWYTKIRVNSRKWQSRWFVLDERLWYCRNPLFPDKGRREVPLWAAYRVDRLEEPSCSFTLRTTMGDVTLRADNQARADTWIAALQERIELQRNLCPDLIHTNGVMGIIQDEEESVWTIPPDASLFRKIHWVLTWPLLALFTVTIPDVRRSFWQKWYPVTILSVCAWLAGLTYVMLRFAERFALVVGIPDDIMGLTITAIGASLPTFFSSVISAREGATGMAVSNAFGANLSSILIAIGLPCFIKSVIITPGVAQEINSEGVQDCVLVCGLALVLFMVSILVTKLRLTKVHGIIFILLYIVLITWVVLNQVVFKLHL